MSYLNLSYWAFIGTFYLIILSYMDIKSKKNLVDERHNYMMYGITLTLLFILHKPFWLILVIILITVLFGMFIKKTKVLGEADIQSLNWIFTGLGFINIWKLAFFCIIFIAVILIYNGIKKYLLKIDKPTPFYPVILITFILSCYFFGLYKLMVLC